MRISRSATPQYKIKKASNSFDREDEDPPVVNTKSLQIPSSFKRNGSRSQPNSRPNSPYLSESSVSNLTDSTSSADSQKTFPPDSRLTTKYGASVSATSSGRSKSFSGKHIVRPHSAGRTAGSLPKTSELDRPSLTPKQSPGYQSTVEHVDGTVNSTLSYTGNVLMRRVNEPRRLSGSSIGRPTSMYAMQGMSDLNQLASELSQLDGERRAKEGMGRSPGSIPRMASQLPSSTPQGTVPSYWLCEELLHVHPFRVWVHHVYCT